MTNIQSLCLTGPQVNDESLLRLKQFSNLRTLLLYATPYVTDEGVSQLSRLTKLEVLSGLEELDLHSTKISDGGLAHLRGLRNLRYLSLENTNVGDEGLKHLGRLTNLEELSLNFTPITSDGLAHLKGLLRLN